MELVKRVNTVDYHTLQVDVIKHEVVAPYQCSCNLKWMVIVTRKQEHASGATQYKSVLDGLVYHCINTWV